MDNENSTRRRSALAIVGLVLGILALLTSLLPIVNNASFFVALIGVVVALVGLASCLRGKRAGKGLAIGAVIVNILAIVAVLGSQSLYGAAVDSAMNGPQAVGVAEDGEEQEDADDQADEDGKNEDGASGLAVGSTVELANGLTISVDEVAPGLVNYDGSTVTGVRVTYVNGSDKSLSFNSYDWKGESADGVRSSPTIYAEASEELNNGDLAAGGTVSGWAYFEGDLVHMLYFSSVFADEPAASWNIA